MDDVTEVIGDAVIDHTDELPISPDFPDVLKPLIEFQEKGVTVFRGGPLEYKGYDLPNPNIKPAIVSDEHGFSMFNIIGIQGKDDDDTTPTETLISHAPDLLLKLGAKNENVRLLDEALLDDDGPKLIVKFAQEGSVAFPLFNMPGYDKASEEIVREREKRLIAALNFPPARMLGTHDTFYDDFELNTEMDDIYLMEPKVIDTQENGIVYAHLAYAVGDPWKYYWLLAHKPLEEIRKTDDRTLFMRVDSGCDSGMIYHDLGCECHAQLIDALNQADDNNGLIVHIPSQDGRGYGMATKMETEAMKQGTPTPFNEFGTEPMDTVQAAMKVFGEKKYDIRTFAGVGALMYKLGFEGLRVVTDSKRKIEGINSGTGNRLRIERVPTNTINSEHAQHCKIHLLAKHLSDDYYDDEKPDGNQPN